MTLVESYHKYNHSSKGLLRKKNYDKSNKGKLAVKKYRQSEKGKSSRKQIDANYYSNHKIDYLQKQKIKRKEYASIMNKLKINGCAICGYDTCYESLDFHHVNPKDKNRECSVKLIECSNEHIVKELNKCILLCKNCHYEIHYNMRIKGETKEMKGIKLNEKVMTYR